MKYSYRILVTIMGQPRFGKLQCTLLLHILVAYLCMLIHSGHEGFCFLFQTNISMNDIKVFPDSCLQNKKDMQRALFLENVVDKKKCVHYTGNICRIKSATVFKGHYKSYCCSSVFCIL